MKFFVALQSVYTFFHLQRKSILFLCLTWISLDQCKLFITHNAIQSYSFALCGFISNLPAVFHLKCNRDLFHCLLSNSFPMLSINHAAIIFLFVMRLWTEWVAAFHQYSVLLALNMISQIKTLFPRWLNWRASMIGTKYNYNSCQLNALMHVCRHMVGPSHIYTRVLVLASITCKNLFP